VFETLTKEWSASKPSRPSRSHAPTVGSPQVQTHG
jgi:hypothetical protein